MEFRDVPTSVAVLLGLLLLGFVSCLGGCASTGIERSDKTRSTMQLVEADYRQVPVQVDATRGALNELIRPGQTDAKRAYDRYVDQVEAMQKLGKKLDKHSAEMKARGRDYFEEWEKQGGTYTNPEIRELSEQRRSELSRSFDQISQESLGARSALDAYLADLKQIQSYLSNDLTSRGLAAITPIAQTAMQDGDRLKESVQPVLMAIAVAKSEMAHGGAPVPPPAPRIAPPPPFAAPPPAPAPPPDPASEPAPPPEGGLAQ